MYALQWYREDHQQGIVIRDSDFVVKLTIQLASYL